MRKIVFYFLSLLYVSWPVAAQTGASAVDMLKEEQQKFIRHLKSISVDSVTVYPLARYFDSEVNSIHSAIISDAALSEVEKEKAVRSLVYFMTQLSNSIVQQKSEMYDIPGAMQSYRDLLAALVHHKSFEQILIPLEPRRTQLLTAAFSQYAEYPLLNDISVYKVTAASPEFILLFLENKPNFRYADSLLVEAATHNPMKLISYLNKGNATVQSRIRKSKNIYLQQIVSLSNDKDASELLPFIIQIAEGKITRDEILAKRADVMQYFQLMVNTLMTSTDSKDSCCVFLKLLRDGIKQKSLSFYVNQINERHTSPDAVRFTSVKNLRAEDLYYIMTSSGEELYTSSYLGLYKRLMEQLKGHAADSLFDIVLYDNFQTFLRLAANYNVATDFLHKMPAENMEGLLRRFMGGIESGTNSGLERAMDIADFFAGLDSATEIDAVVLTELRSNLNRCKASQKYLGVKLYSTLLQVFDLVKQKEGINKLWATLGNYEMLKRDALKSKNQEIVEVVLFYGDEDGTASFSSFSKLYTDTSKWKVSKNANWLSIRSSSEQPITIYANLPLDSEQEMDLRAQDSLMTFLQQQSLSPAVLIHRGHSYHLDKTLKRLGPSVKLAILGSCGGYNKSLSIASINPDVQVIGSKKTGSKSINDPIIDVINETLVEGSDLVWSDIWKKLATRFSKDESTLTLFGEYFSPDNNLSLFVLKLFNL